MSEQRKARQSIIDMGNQVKKRRNELHLTVEQLAEKVGLAPKSLNAIEAGKRGMSYDTLKNISQVLCVTTDYIIFGKRLNNYMESLQEILLSMDAAYLPYLTDVSIAFLSALATANIKKTEANSKQH